MRPIRRLMVAILFAPLLCALPVSADPAAEHTVAIRVRDLPGDEPLRSPMSWNADEGNGGFTQGKPFRPVLPNVARFNAQSQAADPDSLLAFYKAMLLLRNSLPSIARGADGHAGNRAP